MIDITSRVKKVFQLLKDRNETLCVAESCTGGLISNYITNTTGSSQFFVGSVIAYTLSVKIHQLNIPSSLFKKYGAVHPQVAESMAKGVRSLLKGDWSLSITGLMRCEKPPKEIEEGQIFTAVIGPSLQEVRSAKMLGETRSEMKNQSAKFCLDFLISKLEL